MPKASYTNRFSAMRQFNENGDESDSFLLDDILTRPLNTKYVSKQRF